MKTKTLFPLLLLAIVAWMSGCGKSDPATPPQQVYIDSVDESDSNKLQTAEAVPENGAATSEAAKPASETTASTAETTPADGATPSVKPSEQATSPAPAPAEQKPAVKKVFAHSTDGYVNVRSEPNTKSKILGRLTKGGSGARYVETVGEWYKIRYKDSIAYVKSTYASFDSI